MWYKSINKFKLFTFQVSFLLRLDIRLTASGCTNRKASKKCWYCWVLRYSKFGPLGYDKCNILVSYQISSGKYCLHPQIRPEI